MKTDIFHHFWTLTPTDFVTILWVTGDSSNSWNICTDFFKVKIWMASCGEQPQQMNLRSDWKRRDAAAPWGFFFWWEIHGWIFEVFFLVGQFDHLGVWFLWTGVIWSYICSPKADQCQLERIVVGSVVLILILSFWNGPLFLGRVDQMIWECSCRWNEPRCSALMSALQLRSIHEKADGAW